MDCIEGPVRQGLSSLDRPLTEDTIGKILLFTEAFFTAREPLDLMAAVNAEEFVNRHLIDSILGLEILNPPKGASLVDVGSGGGFPGIPISLVRPDLEVTLIEARGKKASFLTDVAARVGDGRINVADVRAEAAGHFPGMRESFDCVVARAMAQTPADLEICLPLLKVGGRLGLWKGPRSAEEMRQAQRALNLLGAARWVVEKYQLPGGAGPRYLVIVEKEKSTPEHYPRRPGIPGKRPL